ncbi:uncharacterized protein LOC123922163 [Trifolium pratense]|uniref:uncharacterized protein LOC123922163 n=1 Tax=Trifolium pratense TaxID=57577 RepID=UPI001E694D1C|nr:uncharacterized protein LOC123922163 [Trifolium pratense]
MRNQPFRPIQNQIPVQHQSMPEYNGYNISHTNPPVRVREEPQVQMGMPDVPNPSVTLVHRNQDADEVVRNVQQDNCDGQNNLANMVETILALNGLNVGLHRPNFVSTFSEYVLQTELPTGWKIPKFTKFAGDTSESTVKHIARYLAEAGDLANNENLRMKYFPNSLTKNAFTWFTTLPPGSIHHWTQLERAFHEQLYMGKSKISLKELSVEMAAGGLDYSIRKKLDTQHLRDMAQLANRVRQVERLKIEKARTSMDLVQKEVDFLNRCKLSNKEVMLCLRCSAVCDKEATAGLTNYVPYVKNKGNWPRQSLNKRKEIVQAPTIQQRLGPKTFVPANRVPVN